MRQFLIEWRTWVFALLLLVLADAFVRISPIQRFFDPVDGSMEAARWRLAYASPPPDIVIAGDSRNGIDLSPGVIQEALVDTTGTEPTIINAAVYGNSMEGTDLFLDHLIDNTSMTPLILLNVSEVALNDAAWTDNPPLSLRALASPLSLASWTSSEGRWAILELFSGLARLRKRLPLTVEGAWPAYLRGEQEYDQGGLRWYGKMSAELQTETLQIYHDKYLKDFSPYGRQGQYFEKLLSKAQANNLRLILIISPVSREFLTAFPTSAGAETFKAYVRTIADRYEIPLFDYYQTPLLGDDMFFDPHHTNWEGTQRFSQIVAEDIIKPALADWAEFQAGALKTVVSSDPN